MKTAVKRKDIPPQRREQILTAAAELFSHSGYHGVTVDAIAQRAGISKGNLYWYFKSKQEIFQLLLDDLFERISQTPQKILESDIPPREKLRAVTMSLLDAAEAHAEAMCLMLQIVAQPELSQIVSAEHSLWMRHYIDRLTPLFAAMDEKDPEGIAILYGATIDGLMGMIAMGSDIYDREKMIATLEERFISFGREKDV